MRRVLLRMATGLRCPASPPRFPEQPIIAQSLDAKAARKGWAWKERRANLRAQRNRAKRGRRSSHDREEVRARPGMNAERRSEWGSRAGPTQSAQQHVPLLRGGARMRAVRGAGVGGLRSDRSFGGLATPACGADPGYNAAAAASRGYCVRRSGQSLLAETGNHVVRKVTPAESITTVAGNGVQGFSGDNGLATAAELDSPAGVAVDAAGNLYIADSHNQRVREVAAATGAIATIAGTGVGIQRRRRRGNGGEARPAHRAGAGLGGQCVRRGYRQPSRATYCRRHRSDHDSRGQRRGGLRGR